jgi:putative transposase
VWNESVATLQKHKIWVKSTDLTAWRAQYDWLRAGSSVAQQQIMREFATKRAKSKGRRKFKADRKTLPSLNYVRTGFSVKDGRLKIAGGHIIPVVWSREFPSSPTSVRIYRDTLGHWYASFVVEREINVPPQTEKNDWH